ncbi:MAG: hypothetical protein QNL04_08445, partial [SAR324 cluster bacterium]|nr:hypothetical protein [SAR324 cluster bacterium]
GAAGKIALTGTLVIPESTTVDKYNKRTWQQFLAGRVAKLESANVVILSEKQVDELLQSFEFKSENFNFNQIIEKFGLVNSLEKIELNKFLKLKLFP